MFRRFALPIALSAFFLFTLTALAHTFTPGAGAGNVGPYYVDAALGNDMSGDGSQGAPWQTVSHALAEVGGQQAEIQVAPGLYDEALGETFPLLVPAGIQLTGADRDNTILQSNGTDYVVHFNSTAFYTETTGIRGFKIMSGHNGVRVTGRIGTPATPLIEDNWITGNFNGVVLLAVEGESVAGIVRDNLVESNENIGIVVSASFEGTFATGTISGNKVTKSGTDGIFCFAHGTGEAGSPGNGICDPVIDGNFVNFNAGDGYHCKTQRTASCGGLLQNNQFLANGGQGIGREHVNNFVIGSAPLLINNIIAHNEGGGAEFLTGDQPLFVNNTLAFNGPLGIHGGLPTIVNSIIWGHTDDLDVPVGQVAYSDVGEPGYASFNNNLSVDPLFVAIAQNDFHLLPASPLINVGNSAYPQLPTTDFEGDPRLWITLVDIGADEFIGPLQQQLLPVILAEN